MNEATVKDRILALLDVVLDGAKINAAFVPTIHTLAKNFLRDVSEDEIRKGVVVLREKYIPWLLGEVPEATDHADTSEK